MTSMNITKKKSVKEQLKQTIEQVQKIKEELIQMTKEVTGAELPPDLSHVEYARHLKNHYLSEVAEAKKLAETLKIEKEAAEQAKHEAEEARDRAEANNRAKTEFLAEISHELRTPLNAILGVTNSLNKNYAPSDSESASYIPLLKNSCDEMLTLIADILEFSRTDGQMALQEDPVNLKRLIENIRAKLLFKAQEKGLKIVLNIDPDRPVKVLTDTQRLRQIISNLVDNALKYSRVGQVTITLDNHLSEDKKHVYVKIIVEDTGIGIPENQQEIVFEKFTRLESMGGRKYLKESGGVGLGLAIVKRFVTKLKGTVHLESKVNVGSKFICEFVFPAPIAEYTISEHLTAIAGARILLVDEDIGRREMWRQILIAWGFRTVSASSVDAMQKMINSFDGGEYFPIVISSAGKRLGALYHITQAMRENPRFSDTIHLAIFSEQADEDEDELYKNGYHVVMEECENSEILFDPLLKVWNEKQNEKAELQKSTLAGKSILVVEDNVINQQILKMMLRGLESHFDFVSTGADALQKLKNNKYDAVLMDVSLADMTGLDITAELRRFETNGHTPVIALTAHAFEEDRNRCFDAGMDDYLTKPLDEGKLLLTLKRWASRGRRV
jgi:two-component system sensor histidine kinase/response regulator